MYIIFQYLSHDNFRQPLNETTSTSTDGPVPDMSRSSPTIRLPCTTAGTMTTTNALYAMPFTMHEPMATPLTKEAKLMTTSTTFVMPLGTDMKESSTQEELLLRTDLCDLENLPRPQQSSTPDFVHSLEKKNGHHNTSWTYC